MTDPDRPTIRIDLLPIAAVAAGILTLDALGPTGSAEIPILVSILGAIVTTTDRTYGSGEHGC